MTSAVAAGSAATAPRERGWRWFVVALVGALLVSFAPLWPPALALLAAVVRVALPFEQLATLALIVFAACAIVGWWAGGQLSIAVLSVAFACWVWYRVPYAPEGYGGFVRGWACALSAGFGLVCLGSGRKPFLGRAVAAVAFAFVVWEAGVTISTQSPLFTNSVRMFGQEYQRRLGDSLELWKNRTDSGAWQAFATRLPAVASRADGVAERFVKAASALEANRRSWLVDLSPALLALESVLALALAWTSYHRLTRTRIGPPLGALRDLRFSDQLIWGLLLGATIALLPTLSTARIAGYNLLFFFGALYALRGVGVLSALVPERVAAIALLVMVLLVSLLGPGLMLLTLLVFAFAIGLSDTWRDFRGAAKAS